MGNQSDVVEALEAATKRKIEGLSSIKRSEDLKGVIEDMEGRNAVDRVVLTFH